MIVISGFGPSARLSGCGRTGGCQCSDVNRISRTSTSASRVRYYIHLILLVLVVVLVVEFRIPKYLLYLTPKKKPVMGP